MKDATHSCASVEWFTPPDIIEAARECMGGIDLDPASCKAANDLVVKSARFYCEADDSLARSWDARSVWLNPPSPPRAWWEELAGTVGSAFARACYMAYSIEQLQQSQGWAGPSMLSYPLCVPRKRVAYFTTNRNHALAIVRRVEEGKADPSDAALWRRFLAYMNAEPDALSPGAQPTHASAIVGLCVDPAKFRKAFSPIGDVVNC